MYKIKVKVINGKDGKLWHEADSLEEAYGSINYLVPCAFLEEGITITISSSALEPSTKEEVEG